MTVLEKVAEIAEALNNSRLLLQTRSFNDVDSFEQWILLIFISLHVYSYHEDSYILIKYCLRLWLSNKIQSPEMLEYYKLYNSIEKCWVNY